MDPLIALSLQFSSDDNPIVAYYQEEGDDVVRGIHLQDVGNYDPENKSLLLEDITNSAQQALVQKHTKLLEQNPQVALYLKLQEMLEEAQRIPMEY